MLENILNFIMENPVVIALGGSSAVSFLAWTAYKLLLKLTLSDKNIHFLKESIDNYVDKIEIQDPKAGKETRKKLINLFQEIIEGLKEPDSH